ncbi:hypothetical protein TREMEDRAFT_59885 [Tremella mesenterica DSM 1558]|uniref:uncharacterized protein n=1 Tax=Tremella mesenterica (strain ATCC 24925 / CBS 8224 / DSM 1558 / NBRC 9311 / NRRL Y-6157 / RJB 2259-6 / UBC 559-6) TaxID=578456 RepID=UPI0003F49B5F|nr:uncharacterized protein TREMEDRAFT_59885 [Tremella mesenterica DSM 1558]EIW73712.1 hypothetical protein TREMEDRAFT_59885 [Tremella mesenterica DSM 1558]
MGDIMTAQSDDNGEKCGDIEQSTSTPNEVVVIVEGEKSAEGEATIESEEAEPPCGEKQNLESKEEKRGRIWRKKTKSSEKTKTGQCSRKNIRDLYPPPPGIQETRWQRWKRYDREDKTGLPMYPPPGVKADSIIIKTLADGTEIRVQEPLKSCGTVFWDGRLIKRREAKKAIFEGTGAVIGIIGSVVGGVLGG